METWQNGGKDLPSNCSTQYEVGEKFPVVTFELDYHANVGRAVTLLFQVYNIKLLQVADEQFTDTKDHSKWAVSTEPGNEWACVGDINRQVHHIGVAMLKLINGDVL